MQNFGGKIPLRKRPLRRSRRRWEDNIKMERKETGCENGEWMELVQGCVQWQSMV
jgi:hypothetical protein